MGRDDQRKLVGSGFYFCRLAAGDEAATIKLISLRESPGQTLREMLVSDNCLRYPPRLYESREVAIRGRVLPVIRTPSRREARFLGNVEFAEVHRSEYIQQAMMFLPRLSEREQRAVAEHIKVLAEKE